MVILYTSKSGANGKYCKLNNHAGLLIIQIVSARQTHECTSSNWRKRRQHETITTYIQVLVKTTGPSLQFCKSAFCSVQQQCSLLYSCIKVCSSCDTPPPIGCTVIGCRSNDSDISRLTPRTAPATLLTSRGGSGTTSIICIIGGAGPITAAAVVTGAADDVATTVVNGAVLTSSRCTSHICLFK